MAGPSRADFRGGGRIPGHPHVHHSPSVCTCVCTCADLRTQTSCCVDPGWAGELAAPPPTSRSLRQQPAPQLAQPLGDEGDLAP